MELNHYHYTTIKIKMKNENTSFVFIFEKLANSKYILPKSLIYSLVILSGLYASACFIVLNFKLKNTSYIISDSFATYADLLFLALLLSTIAICNFSYSLYIQIINILFILDPSMLELILNLKVDLHFFLFCIEYR